MGLGFGKPVPDGGTVIGGGWGAGPGGKHAGIDIRVVQGTPVVAVGEGTVLAAAAGGDNGGMGTFAAIMHPSGVVTRYLHLSQLLVAPGQPVSRGQLIGRSGNTGNSAGPHLHFDIKVPSPIALAQLVSQVGGEPPGGFEPNITGYGVGIPAEPWIPADRYEPSVVASALANGIPLYQARGVADFLASSSGAGILLVGGAAALLGALIYRRRKG
jgi:murein DD-endopeptidase MepM/ murein hydrolase activator NlpD